MKILTYRLGSFAANCYLVYGEISKIAVLIDPGEYDLKILNALSEKDLIIAPAFQITCYHGNHESIKRILDRSLFGHQYYLSKRIRPAHYLPLLHKERGFWHLWC
jgi:hypothetical protein